MKVLSITHAHGKALYLFVGAEASTPIFARPRDNPSLLDFDPSKKCEHHFGAKGHTLEECTNLRYQIQDLVDNKLV